MAMYAYFPVVGLPKTSEKFQSLKKLDAYKYLDD